MRSSGTPPTRLRRSAFDAAMKVARTLQALSLLLLGWVLLGVVGWLGGMAVGWLWAMLALALLHVPLMALEFVLLRRVARGDPAPVPRAIELLRAWLGETMGAVRVFAWQMPWRRWCATVPYAERRHCDTGNYRHLPALTDPAPEPQRSSCWRATPQNETVFRPGVRPRSAASSALSHRQNSLPAARG